MAFKRELEVRWRVAAGAKYKKTFVYPDERIEAWTFYKGLPKEQGAVAGAIDLISTHVDPQESMTVPLTVTD